MESLSLFFYNIVPGTLFLSTIYILKIRDLTNDLHLIPPEIMKHGEILILAIIVLSLFIGFILQALAKLMRLPILDRVFGEVEKENESAYPKAIGFLKEIGSQYEDSRKEAIFTMHNYLEATESGKLPRIFTAISAFWSNMTSGTFIFLIYEVCWKHDIVPAGLFLLCFVLSLWISKWYLKTQYDIVVKTFASMMVFNSETKHFNDGEKNRRSKSA